MPNLKEIALAVSEICDSEIWNTNGITKGLYLHKNLRII